MCGKYLRPFLNMETYKLEKIIQTYFSQYPLYLRLGENIKGAIESLLVEKETEIASVDYRVKKLEQFLKKIDRKKYTDPFEQMTDICGIRIICYLKKDIKIIEKIIEKEFEIVEKNEKLSSLPLQKFGYRSNHLVIKIKNDWVKTPNYRGLENLKVELQIRTILMHAWAEIEHKLAYKKAEHVPRELRRKFSRVSAILEEADEQFQEISDKVDEKKRKILTGLKEYKTNNKEINFDLDTLKILLDYYFPKKVKDSKIMRDFFDEIAKSKITIKDLLELYKNKMKNE